MSPARVSRALLERLGEPAAAELTDILDTRQRETTEAVMNHCAERFERRLVEETSKLRVEMTQGFSGIRQEMADGRIEMLKWSFAFWVGQLVAVAGIVSLLTAAARR